MHTTRKLLLGLGATAAVSLALGYGVARYQPLPHLFGAAHATAPADASIHDVRNEIYSCPMHPEVLRHEPGNCPICNMKLVKAMAGGSDAANQPVHVDEATRMRMGVRTEAAALTQMHHTVSAYAAIAADESKSVVVTPRFDGWIKRLHVQGVGQTIRKGQVLYEIYSLELQQRQRDYIDLLTRRDALLGAGTQVGGPTSAMLGSLAKERFKVRDRLIAADVPPEVIDVLEKQHRIFDVVPIRAAHDGIVTAISAREGNAVNPMQPILTYADNSRVWAEITLFPDQLGWIRNGDDIVLTSNYRNTGHLNAKVNLSTLQIDPVGRTAKLRVALPNAGAAFLPGSFADVTIRSQARRALAVPKDALIRTGHGDFVVVSGDGGYFRSVAVKTGLEDDQLVEILDGLSAGTRVATNGQFLLDAASSIQSMQRRQAAENAATADENHHHAGAMQP